MNTCKTKEKLFTQIHLTNFGQVTGYVPTGVNTYLKSVTECKYDLFNLS